MKFSSILFFVVAFLNAGFSSYSAFSLDSGVDIYNDVDSTDAFYKRFSDTPLSDTTPLFWLSAHVDRLPTLFRYELARRLQALGMHEQALKEVAKARILRDMEVEQCSTKNTSRVKNVLFLTDNIETGVHGADRIADPLWISAIGEALNWGVPQRVAGFTSSWICGTGNVEKTLKAIRASQAKYTFLSNDYEKLKASSVNK